MDKRHLIDYATKDYDFEAIKKAVKLSHQRVQMVRDAIGRYRTKHKA